MKRLFNGNNASAVQMFRICLYVFLGGFGYLFLSVDVNYYTYVQYLFLSYYLIIFIFEYMNSKHRFFILPPAVFMLYSFINVVLGGILYAKYGIGSSSYFNGDAESIVRGTWYTLVASQILWVSFYFMPDARIKYFKNLELKNISKRTVYILTIISLVSILIGIRLGIYGYVSENEYENIVSYMRYASYLGWLAIIYLAVYNYDDPKSRILLYGLIILYFIVGVAFGSKSTTVLPFIFLVVSLYVTKRKIGPQYIMIGMLFVIIAYAIIEPFRDFYGQYGINYNVKNYGDFTRLYIDSVKSTESADISEYPLRLIERQSYIVPLAMTIQYAENNEYYSTEELKNIVLSPLYAIVPRFLWESKPMGNFGKWASVNIAGSTEANSVGITPQGYAFLVGRFPGIVLYFLLAGIVQRFLFNLFYLNHNCIPFYVLFYFEIGNPADVPWTYISGSVKNIIYMTIIMSIMYLINKYNRLQNE